MQTENDETELETFKAALKTALEARSIIEPLERTIRNGTSTAGKRPEEVFTREYLCPAIRSYFESLRTRLKLAEDDVKTGLGTEGFTKCPGFGFTPASSKANLFTKHDVINPEPPERWFKSCTEALSAFQACPDFAVTAPLPFSVVGEVKYINRSMAPTAAARELYNAARQATFYLAAFRERYRSALLVIADASPNHSFMNGLGALRPELLERFGVTTGIHLVVVGLR